MVAGENSEIQWHFFNLSSNNLVQADKTFAWKIKQNLEEPYGCLGACKPLAGNVLQMSPGNTWAFVVL